MTRRLSILVVILGLLVAGLLLDGPGDSTEAPVETGVVAPGFPVASDGGALASTWFCAGGTGDDEAFADHVVNVLNPTDLGVSVTITVHGGAVAPPLESVDEDDLDGEGDQPDESDGGDDGGGDGDDEDGGEDGGTSAAAVGAVETMRFDLAPRTRQELTLSEIVAAPVVSALVEADGGGIVVEHQITSVHGRDVKPCVTRAESTWHFAFGDTSVDSRELLVLFNPFPGDAVVDARFSTEDGVREPVRLSGFVVPGRSTVAVDVGDDVTRRAEVAATVIARSGRIVVDRIVRINGDGRRGLTVQSGVPQPLETWVFPDGFTSETISEEYVVYNPTDRVAEVEIAVALDDPETNGVPEPFDLSLPPGTHEVVDVSADERVPADVAHSATVRSVNSTPIVAERILYASGDTRRGISVTTGAPAEATEWTFAAGAATDATDEWLVLVNRDPRILTEFSVTAVTRGQEIPVADLQGVELAGGQRLAIRLGDHINRPDLPIVVTSSEPIVVERALYRVGAEVRGMSHAVGVPSPEGLRSPVDPTAVDPESVDLGDLEDVPTDGDEAPTAPDDVELPDPDATIVIDDPDAEADAPESSSTTRATTSTTGGSSSGDGVPDTAPDG